MKHFFATTVALSCAFAAGSAWADAANVSTDAPSSRQIASEILKNTAVGPYGFRVRTTSDGVVHLTGSVISIQDWKTADADARNASGVAGVQNNLSILVR
ncbi:MAG TPA: BON domain-containing protein [Polyangiales bacterium]|nr:BON domain-containing protein [Polyangiales bacterium]